MLPIVLSILTGVILIILAAIIIFPASWTGRGRYMPWSHRKVNSKDLIELQNKQQAQEQKLELRKKNIQMAVKSRTLAKRIILEVKDVVDELRISEEFNSLYSNIFSKMQLEYKDLLSELEKAGNLEECQQHNIYSDYIQELHGVNDGILKLIQSIYDKDMPEENRVKVISELNDHMEIKYEEIIRLHKKLIESYQQEFSTL